MENLAQLEALCERLYNSQDSAERTHAENTLKCFSMNTDYISQCQYILDNASTPYALMMASSSLLKQVTEQHLPLQLRIDIRNTLIYMQINYVFECYKRLEVGLDLKHKLSLQSTLPPACCEQICALCCKDLYLHRSDLCTFSEGNYILNYLASRGPELENFVITSIIQLFCRITKFGWFDDDSFREVVGEATKFLNQKIKLEMILDHLPLFPESGLPRKATPHYAIGLKILSEMISEINQPNPGSPSTNHRRVSNSFKDQSLLQIFRISLTSLCQLKDEAGSKLHELALTLSLKCLSFDFMGSSLDESSDDVGTIQIPSSWRPVIEDPTTMQIFFDYYAITIASLSKDALECLVRLASARRTLFTNDASRLTYLAHLMTGTKEILETGKGLADHDNYHEFCRLLGRFKVNYQLSELVTMEGYSTWIHLVAEFTLKSLQSWQWASGSVYYLLGLWSRLVASVPYLKADVPNLLNEYVPKIIEHFISSKFDSAQAGLPDDLSEDPLDNAELLQDQLECIPYLCRFQYGSCSMYIMQITDPILQIYMEAVSLPANKELVVIETKLAWIVHIVAAIVKMKQFSGVSEDSQEILDAELSARVLRLINITDCGLHSQRYGEVTKQRLDRAILVFFQNFRKSYIGDQAIHSSKQLYGRLSELLGLNDHLLVLNVIVGKIATNLKCYVESDVVINHTLSLFLEMASGYMTGKMLLKLDTVQFIISHHNREHFPFLEDFRCSRSRTSFYYIIGQLIFMEDSLPKFKSSMDPHMKVFVGLETTPDGMFRMDSVKYALIGLMRDLRGIVMATNSRRTYNFLFDWLYPARMPLLLRAITHWYDTPEVTTPLLKLVAEFVLNKSQRLTFDSSSPNGILLFREVSKLIVAYGSQILSFPNFPDMYTFKYKGISIVLSIMSRALSGNYVNFGVFELYGDRALSDALDIIIRMILSIPLPDILAYRKLRGAYYGFLEVLLNSQISFVLKADASTFRYIVGSLESGLTVLDTNILSQCASAIDNLATFYFNNITLGESPSSPAALGLARNVADCPDVFPEILKTLFEIILFEDCGNHWSLSRPMLSLMLLSEEMFTNLKAQILASQARDEHGRLSLCFDKLMGDMSRSLDNKNRDRFTQNLTKFRNEFRSR